MLLYVHRDRTDYRRNGEPRTATLTSEILSRKKEKKKKEERFAGGGKYIQDIFFSSWNATLVVFKLNVY